MKPIILETTNESLEIVLTGAITTNHLQWTVDFFDVDKSVSPRTYDANGDDGVTNNTTDVVVCAAPAASHHREVTELTVFNADTVDAELTVKKVNGANERIIFKGTLIPKATWSLSNFDAAGSISLSLDNLSDVAIASVANGQVLAYESGWANKYGGKLVQMVSVRDGEVATGTTVIPFDDTIPQNTEGNQYLSLEITPKATTHKLVIRARAMISSSAAGQVTMALFQDTTADALAVAIIRLTSTLLEETIDLEYVMDAGTTSATTFKIRIGNTNAGTTTFNGNNSLRSAGGKYHSGITIEEIRV